MLLNLEQRVLGLMAVLSMSVVAPQLTLAKSFPTGGTIAEYTDGGSIYRMHTFDSNSTFSIPADSPVASFDYLAVGAGGSLADARGAGGLTLTSCRELGGGAGGQVLNGSSNSLTGDVSVTVGAGGATISFCPYGNNGNPSSFGAIQPTGGGVACRPSDASLYTGDRETYTNISDNSIISHPPGVGSGFSGGDTAGDNDRIIAAGGGAGAGGDVPSLSQSGSGGIGVASIITGTSVYYGCGGGACGASLNVSGGPVILSRWPYTGADGCV